MATTELRIYRIRDGLRSEFASRFMAEVAPARRASGFTVIGPWVDDSDQTFVWMARYDGDLSWDDAAAAYSDSPGRRGIGFDPMDFIESIDTRLLDDV